MALCSLMLIGALSASPVLPPDLIREIAALVAEHHISSPTRQQVVDRLRRGESLAFLDPYTQYLPPEDGQRAQGWEQGPPSLGGRLLQEQGQIWLVPRRLGPLRDAGIERPRILRLIDGNEVSDLPVPVIRSRLRTRSSVELGLVATGSPVIQFLRVTPARFDPPPVEFFPCSRLIRIYDFVPRQTSEAVRGALSSLKGHSPEGTVTLDLRFATGGDLFEAMDTATLFLQKDEVLAFTEDAARRRQTYRGLEGGAVWSKPVEVLIGPQTASAAEVLVRALRDQRAARLIGQASYGKCTSQALLKLSNGGTLKLTNLKLLGPKEECDPRGIRPDSWLEGSDFAQAGYRRPGRDPRAFCSSRERSSLIGSDP